MKKIIIFGAVLALLFCAGCVPYSEMVPETPEEVVQIAMYVLGGGESDQPLILGTDGTPAALATPTGLAQQIAAHVGYEVVSMEQSGESATAVLNVTAPDTVTLVYQALEGMESFDQTSFTAELDALLSDAPPTVTNTVTVELQRVEGTWCMVINEAFSNAVTGGLVAEYAAVQQAIYDAVLKGGAG